MRLTCLLSFAQDHPDQDRDHNGTYRQHDERKKCSRRSQKDWNRTEKVDYRSNHSPRPPESHEWRQNGGIYVLANHDGTIICVRPAPQNHEPS